MCEVDYLQQPDLFERQEKLAERFADRQELLLKILLTADRVADKYLEEPSHRD